MTKDCHVNIHPCENRHGLVYFLFLASVDLALASVDVAVAATWLTDLACPEFVSCIHKSEILPSILVLPYWISNVSYFFDIVLDAKSTLEVFDALVIDRLIQISFVHFP